jgi:hypothetical protein
LWTHVPCVDDGDVTSSPPRARTHDQPPLGDPTLAPPVRPEPLLGSLLALLELRADDLLVQLGCALPEHLLALTELVPLRCQALVVHPSPETELRVAGERATLRAHRRGA